MCSLVLEQGQAQHTQVHVGTLHAELTRPTVLEHQTAKVRLLQVRRLRDKDTESRRGGERVDKGLWEKGRVYVCGGVTYPLVHACDVALGHVGEHEGLDIQLLALLLLLHHRRLLLLLHLPLGLLLSLPFLFLAFLFLPFFLLLSLLLVVLHFPVLAVSWCRWGHGTSSWAEEVRALRGEAVQGGVQAVGVVLGPTPIAQQSQMLVPVHTAHRTRVAPTTTQAHPHVMRKPTHIYKHSHELSRRSLLVSSANALPGREEEEGVVIVLLDHAAASHVEDPLLVHGVKEGHQLVG